MSFPNVEGVGAMALYDVIGVGYDTARKADPQIVARLRNHLQALDRTRVLDVACGTGNYTVALARSGLNMTGADISEEMLSQARMKSSEVKWAQADVARLPYPDAAFSGATCILAIHHFDDLKQAFRQVYRTMGKGRFVIFTASPEQMERYWLKEYFPKAMEDSCKQMPSLTHIVEALTETGFKLIGLETFLIQPDLQDFFLYSGKYDPSLYLDPKVRAGISTFAHLASQEEIDAGCARLRADIDSGEIHEVRGRYSSDLGDYVFVVAEK
jgi:ubiquinone/menaquinone biosynthesis C-methylase UbiE